MAVEYIYDAIRATAGEDISICAVITDEDGELVADNCYLTFYDNVDEMTRVYGTFDGSEWCFIIPAVVTKYLCGRYWYSIGRNSADMCFKTPIYLV